MLVPTSRNARSSGVELLLELASYLLQCVLSRHSSLRLAWRFIPHMRARARSFVPAVPFQIHLLELRGIP
jgi:hypothetical protein